MADLRRVEHAGRVSWLATSPLPRTRRGVERLVFSRYTVTPDRTEEEARQLAQDNLRG